MTAPGWYRAANDPAGVLRWWDGTGWTEHVHPAPRPAATMPPVTPPAGQAQPVRSTYVSQGATIQVTAPQKTPARGRRRGLVALATIVGLTLLALAAGVGIYQIRQLADRDEDPTRDPTFAIEADADAEPDASALDDADADAGEPAQPDDPAEDPGASSSTAVTTSTTTTTIPDDLGYQEVIDASLADVEAFWRREQPAVFGTEHDSVANIIPYRPSDPATYPSCNGVLDRNILANNAFYCPRNDTIAWDDELLLPRLYDDFGDLAVAMVLVHEYSHAVQNRVPTQSRPTIVIELQADCYTGAWAASVEAGNSTTGLRFAEGDLDEALAGYLTVRDPPGTDPLDPSAHGNGFDRLSSFVQGFEEGVDGCSTIDDEPPVSSKLAPTLADQATGGNLPLESLMPLLDPELDRVFAALAADAGLDYTSPVRQSFDSRIGEVGACPGGASGPIERDAIACTASSQVWWDIALQEELFASVGDIGATYPLIHAWALLIVVENDLASGQDAVELADCWSGAFLGVLFPRTDRQSDIDAEIRLSPGDLDEAIGTLLVYQPLLPNGEGRYEGAAFDRLDDLRNGATRGVPSCTSR